VNIAAGLAVTPEGEQINIAPGAIAGLPEEKVKAIEKALGTKITPSP